MHIVVCVWFLLHCKCVLSCATEIADKFVGGFKHTHVCQFVYRPTLPKGTHLLSVCCPSRRKATHTHTHKRSRKETHRRQCAHTRQYVLNRMSSITLHHKGICLCVCVRLHKTHPLCNSTHEFI